MRISLATEFEREIRLRSGLDATYVLDLIRYHDGNSGTALQVTKKMSALKNALQFLNISIDSSQTQQYPFVLVMPLAKTMPSIQKMR